MGWYVVIKTIKGHRYYYRQTTWREGGQVKCHSIYLKPVDGSIRLGPIGKGMWTKTPEGKPTPVAYVLSDDRSYNIRRGVIPADVGEAEFIDILLDPQPEDRFVTGYSWIGKNPNRPMKLDPELIEIPRRMGFNILNKQQAGKQPYPAHIGKRASIGYQMPYGVVPENHSTKPTVVMPDPGRWRDEDGLSAEKLYGIVLLHEVVHATKDLLLRPKAHRKYDTAYAAEELVAEIAACLVARELGLLTESVGRSRAYIRSWRRKLSEPRVQRAVHDARMAAKLVLAFHRKGDWQPDREPHAVVDELFREGLPPLRPSLADTVPSPLPAPVVGVPIDAQPSLGTT